MQKVKMCPSLRVDPISEGLDLQGNLTSLLCTNERKSTDCKHTPLKKKRLLRLRDEQTDRQDK